MDYFTMITKRPCDKEALVLAGQSYTYGELVTLAQEKAEAIQQQILVRNQGGFCHEDREDANMGDLLERKSQIQEIYMIKSEHILEQLLAFLACNAIGVIPLIVPFDSKEKVEHILSLAQRTLERLKKRQVEETQIAKQPKAICMAVMTSGTTGMPKVYFRSYESWAGFFDTQNEIFQIDERSRLFAHGSLAFTGNLNLYLAQFYAGGTVIAEEKFDPRRWVQVIEGERANAIYLIPTKLMLLPKVYRTKHNDRIYMILSGSQSLGLDDAKTLKEVFPCTRIILYYGASELNYITYITEQEMTDQKNLIGKPFPKVQVSILDGALYIDTKYHVEGITTPYTLQDMGEIDEEGNFYFLGRSDDMMNIRGRKVSALKVENAFLPLPYVREVAVKAREYKGNMQIEAYVVCDGCKKIASCKKKWHTALKEILAPYEMPKQIRIVKELPKNESGKVVKAELDKVIDILHTPSF